MESSLDASDSTCSSMFPEINEDYIMAFQFSSWFPPFSFMSIKSTIIKPLDRSFKIYLESNGVFVPEGSEDVVVESTLSDDNESGNSDESGSGDQRFSFPELDARIRSAINEYRAVFPKLNFSSPKDAAWVLPMSSPLKCTSPADVYLLLKSSDFITHDLNIDHVFEGCNAKERPQYDLELILRKWYPIDRSREMRCFVRNNTLVGICQRDMNFYDYMIDPTTQINVRSTVQRLWEEKIRPKWTLTRPDYIFDLLLTRDLTHGYVLDFNPYTPRTDPLLFSYEELYALFVRAACGQDHSSSGSATRIEPPELRVVDSPMHLAATRNAPAHQHNMLPVEALNLSEGKNITEFAEIWRDEVKRAMQDEDEDQATGKSAD